MYSSTPSYIFGFHGLDKDIAFRILKDEIQFKHSNNNYDWLGNGIYFWENNYQRAKEYAVQDKKRPTSKIKKPFVLGAVIDLGNCLDLLDQKNLNILKKSYELLYQDLTSLNKVIPRNGSFGEKDIDFRKRELDCAVIRYAHELAKEEGIYYDSVRAAFWEGEPLYENAGFKKQNHIQVSVLNQNCIKGIFLPREKVNFPK